MKAKSVQPRFFFQPLNEAFFVLLFASLIPNIVYGKVCTEGKRCGKTCISKDKVCRKDLQKVLADQSPLSRIDIALESKTVGEAASQKESFNAVKKAPLARWTESQYIESSCGKNFHGKSEETLIDGTRVDCVNDEYAIEFDFAKKWKESVGQALHYARLTNKKPAVAIIIENTNEEEYVNQLESTIDHFGLNIEVYRISRGAKKQDLVLP